jgi:hypothetical protein
MPPAGRGRHAEYQQSTSRAPEDRTHHPVLRRDWQLGRCHARRQRHGTDNLVLLAADAKAEDPDLCRLVADAAALLSVEPVVVADGRTPWQVFADQRFVGNSRIAPCSAFLTQRPCRA